ncbi:MAG TPA: type II toxin-antitoxin system VapC family toxin [Hyphomicrobiaceae bacterium]|nr:type II toxin-antitoxin system VapC family toxin [Hyphomicrobiaceae bacterium]
MIVVDANVAIKWVVEQPHFERAREIIAQGAELLVPAMFVAEVTTALWGYVRLRQITPAQAEAGLTSILEQISLIEEDADLAGEALSIGSELNHAPYDCFYLVLAMRRTAPLVTVDARFVNKLAGTRYESHVVHLSDWT